MTGWFFVYGSAGYIKSLANWGVFLVLSSLICSSMVPYSKNYRKKPKLMALNHALFSMAILIQLLDFFSYWLTLNHESTIKKNKHTELIVLYQYAQHILPPLACIYNFAITDFLFYRKFYKVSLFGTVLYFVANYIKDRHWQDFLISQGLGGPKLSKRPPELLKWNDRWTPYFIAVVCCISIIIPFILAWCTEIIKHRRLPAILRESSESKIEEKED